MQGNRLVVVTVGALLFCCSSEPSNSSAVPAAADMSARVWNFDADTVDEPAAGFTGHRGDWRVVSDATAPSKTQVLAQLAKSEGSIFNVALVDEWNYRDVDVSVQLRSITGRIDQGGGLVWRALDAQNYYIARYNPLEDNYRVYYVKDGRRVQIQSANLSVDHETWHTLRISMSGEHIQCFLDGTKYLDIKDPTFVESGRLGLWTKADAHTHFDNLTVVEAPAEIVKAGERLGEYGLDIRVLPTQGGWQTWPESKDG